MVVRRALGSAALAMFVAGCIGNEGVRAPVVDRSVQPPAIPSTGALKVDDREARHTVVRGETLYSIAADRGVDLRELAQLNRIDDPAKLQVGQVLRLPAPRERSAAAVPEARAVATPGVGKMDARPLEAEASRSGGKPQPAARPTEVKPVPKAPETATAGGLADGPRPQFAWPGKGRLLAGFSEPQRRGIDIGGDVGDPVYAAASGRVMYTGTGIRGYGKLIVILHDHGYNSVYAHNREILVKEGDQVRRGQKIAEMGDSESDKPKLHFEIRRSGKPVDPLKYLPERPS